jgi:hypothetical protein
MSARLCRDSKGLKLGLLVMKQQKGPTGSRTSDEPLGEWRLTKARKVALRQDTEAASKAKLHIFPDQT